MLLVDTAATEARTLALREAVRSLSAAPVRTVVNTHHHGDHTHGNHIFADTARIIGHERCPEEVVAQGELLRRVWPTVDWGRTDQYPPTDTYADRLGLTVGDIRVELVHVPPAHSTNDTVVWLPDHGVLFLGDVVFSRCTPFILMGSLSGSLAAIGRLRAFGAETLVSGHGPVADAAVFDVAERYLTWLTALAAESHAAGRSALEAARAARAGEFEGWDEFAGLGESERLPANLRRAYAELDGAEPGAPLDIAAAIADMAAFHGGLPASYA